MGWAKRRGVAALSLLGLCAGGCAGAENSTAPLQGQAGTFVTTTAATPKERAAQELTGLTSEYFRVLNGLYFDPALKSAGPELQAVAAGDGYVYTKADVDGIRSRGATVSGDPLAVVKVTLIRSELPERGPASAAANVCFDAPPGFITKSRKPDGTVVSTPGMGKRQLVLEFRSQGWPVAQHWREKDGWRIVRNSLLQDKKSGECDAR